MFQVRLVGLEKSRDVKLAELILPNQVGNTKEGANSAFLPALPAKRELVIVILKLCTIHFNVHIMCHAV